ncbi:MAG: GreA/GreB family elongation factor [Dehalococcoidales bacterium]|nr:GreA/GreB family elongation factor [Dehalococcoidales bacterium]
MVTGEPKTNLSLGDAASQYLATLSEEKKDSSQPVIHAFVRWYGWDKQIGGIKGAEAGKFAERLSQSDSEAAKKLEILRGFFTYAKKENWTRESLAVSMRVKRPKSQNSGSVRRVVREPIPLTQAMYDSLQADLVKLQSRRIEVVGDIQRAAADKDFRENVPYHAAREQKGMIEGKIMEIEETLARAVITEEKQEKSQLVCVGDAIVLQVADSQQELRYILCNPKEVAPAKGKISVISPVGKAALGKKQGDTITVAVPAGKMQYVILRIER